MFMLIAYLCTSILFVMLFICLGADGTIQGVSLSSKPTSAAVQKRDGENPTVPADEVVQPQSPPLNVDVESQRADGADSEDRAESLGASRRDTAVVEFGVGPGSDGDSTDEEHDQMLTGWKGTVLDEDGAGETAEGRQSPALVPGEQADEQEQVEEGNAHAEIQ
eukprot:m.264134 g.264134  ORF g.264134 m.264134 type:complete len:164 (+) comp15609_c5_seq1:890-1381(+)